MSDRPRRWFLLQPDGSSDEPQESLGGRTPLAAARTPNLDRIAGLGRHFALQTIPEGYPPGSDIGNMALLGYDPRRFYTGRSPIEAAAQGIRLSGDEVAFRCNLVSMSEEADGERVIRDFSAGHIESAPASRIIQDLDRELAGARLYPGVSYRHTLVCEMGIEDLETTPPHDVQDQPAPLHLPAGPGADRLREWMLRAREILAEHPVNEERRAIGLPLVTDIWLWGQGRATELPSLEEQHGMHGAMITAVDLLRGLAVLTEMTTIEVEGATGFLDTNYAGKAEAALGVEEGLVFVHVEASDECSHMGRVDYKIEAIERFDADVAGPIVEAALETGAGVVVSPDHPTLLRTKAHARLDVPCVAWWPGIQADDPGAGYSEDILTSAPRLEAWELLRVVREDADSH